MKLFNKYFLFALMAACLFSACSDDEYQAGEPVEGEYYFFPNTVASRIDLTKMASSFNVEVCRSTTGVAETLSIAVTDGSEGAFSIPTSVDFAADSQVATLTIGYDASKLAYDDYKTVTLKLTDGVTPYGLSEYTFEAGIPAPWITLGKATYSDSFFFTNAYAVDLQQNEEDPSQYRLVKPLTTALSAEGAALEASGLTPDGSESEYITFKLLEPGDQVNDITITGEGLVYFDAYSTGLNNTQYGAVIGEYHPSAFAGDFQNEAMWQYSRVTQYQEDGTPGIVQLAPYYYMDGVGGWNNTQADGMVTIVFPGFVITDFSATVAYTGRYYALDGTCYAMGNVTLGADVASAKVALVAGDDVAATEVGIKDGSIESTEITASGSVSLPCTEDGLHTFVVVTYDGEGEAQSSAYTRFLITTGTTTWKSLGEALYTDAYVGNAYGGENVTYKVEIQESEDTPGLYRLVNPYGVAFPYNEEGDWDDSRDYYIEINAADANGVYIPVQNTGLNWGDGNFYVYSMAAYYLDNGASLDETKAKGVCGTLKDGVITFPSKSLLFAFFESDASLYQTGDGFKLVLPGYYEDEPEAESAGTKALVNACLNKGKMTVAEANVLPLPAKATLLK